MPNVFTPKADVIARAVMALAALAFLGVCVGMYALTRPRGQPTIGMVQPQPVMFSHEHHVGRIGLDCRYCHAHAEESDFAGLPTAETCMNCHLQLYTDAAMLEPVRAAWRENRPVAWRRVYTVPDFLRFSHKVHVNDGVACVSCHGRMDEQSLTAQSTPMTMAWCIDCHRHPDRRLVALDHVYEPGAEPGHEPTSASVDRRGLLTNCSACHY